MLTPGATVTGTNRDGLSAVTDEDVMLQTLRAAQACLMVLVGDESNVHDSSK